MAIMTVAGDAFNVVVEGDEDKPVLMISNPLGTSLQLWDWQMPSFLEHFRVVRYDSRGHGDSVANEGPYSIEGLGRDALAIMDTLGIEKVHWLGLSMGGIVGLWILANAPERVERAVLANAAAHIPGPDAWNSRIEAVRQGGMDSIAESLAERWFTKSFRDHDPGAVETVLSMLRATPVQGYVAGCTAVRDVDLREAIRSIARPVLVIVGRHDQSTPPGMGGLIASSIEGAKLVTLEAAHISNVEDAEAFTRAVIEFLTADNAGKATRPRRAAAARKAAPRKMAARKAPAPKAAAKKGPARREAVAKAVAKKAAAKKPAAKKPAAKQAAAKQAATGKESARKAPQKAAPAKKAPAKGPAAKQAPAKKAPAKKAPVKKEAPRKAAIKKAPVAKAPAKKAGAKKGPAKKAAAKKAPVKKVSAAKKTAPKAATKKAAARKARKKL